MSDPTEILADRLNSEPVIFRGSSSSELTMIMTLAVIFWLPFSLIVASLLGAITLGLGIAITGVLATVLVGSTLFQRVKRGRPDHYYQHLLILKLHDEGLKKAKLIRYSGPWSLGRDGPRIR